MLERTNIKVPVLAPHKQGSFSNLAWTESGPVSKTGGSDVKGNAHDDNISLADIARHRQAHKCRDA
jgi:hypothetical protein